MKVSFALVCLLTLLAARAQAATVSGTVRDGQGAPVPGAQVTLQSDQDSPPPVSAASDDHGQYRFASVAPGAYHLQVSLSESAGGPPRSVSVASGSAEVSVDLTLSQTAPRPQFEAAGIRGLIDPGGYSASTNAAAASGLIKGIADIKRTGNDPTPQNSPGASCALEPQLQQAVKQHPESVQANLGLGDFYLQHGQAAKAIAILEHARSLDRANLRPRNQLAEAYLEVGQFASAETLLTAPSETEHSAEASAEKLRLLARAREGQGKFTAAASDYQAAAVQDPSEQNLFSAGYELILAGLPQQAERAFQAGLARYPRSSTLLIGLGSAQFLEGRSSDSIPTLLRAAELDPADPRPYPFLAQASAVSPVESEQVHRAFERFLSVAPNDPQAYYDCALNLLRQHAADGAAGDRIEGLLKHAIQLDPGLADAHFELGVLYGYRQQYPLASGELETAVRLSPNLQEAHYRLALAYRQTGNSTLSAKEMQIFEEKRTAAKPEAVNIAPFISVFAAPQSGSKPGNICPGDLP